MTTEHAAARGIRNDPAAELLPWLRKMLDTQPVHLDQNGHWHVFRHAEVCQVLSDPATFSSDSSAFTSRQADFDLFAKGNIVDIDPPRHRHLRALINQVFTARTISALEPRIAAITQTLLDKMAGAGEFDFVDALACPLPIAVIAHLLGVPVSDWGLFRAWTDDLFSQAGTDNSTTLTEEKLTAAAPTLRQMNEYLLGHVRQRRAQPADDLLGRLVTAEIAGQHLDDDEIMGFAGLLLIAGQVTTQSLLGNIVIVLDQHPEAAAELRAEPELLPAAIEEVLRYRSPFTRLDRVTTVDTELGGQPVRAGCLVVPWLAAANRDPLVFPDPDRFDPRRSASHVAFGRGIHFCLGAPLARLEAKIAMSAVLSRYPRLMIDHGRAAEFHNPWFLNGAKRLPVSVR